jgi:outer membrane receptor protein involved in Fe transport
VIIRICSASIIATAIILSNAAYATKARTADQDAGPDRPKVGVSEIIVTATKRAEALNDVPMSISAASGDTLLQAGITDVSGLTKIVPGFNAIDSSYGTPIYYLRGVGFFETSLLAKPTVGVYVDEVPQPYSVMTLGASMDLERVEVLKGPQGTLFGSNATGGGVNYIAAKPTDTLESGLNLSYGRFSEARMSGFASGPLSSTLSARLALDHQSRGDWQRSVTRPDDTAGRRDFTAARVSLLWKPSDRLTVLATGSGFIDKSDTLQAQFVTAFQQTSATVLVPGLTSVTPATGGARQADWTVGWPLGRDNRMGQVSLRTDYDAADSLRVSSITSYAYFEADQSQDADGTAFRLSDYTIKGRIKSFNQELRLAGGADSLRYVAGVNYEHSKGPERRDEYLRDQTAARSLMPLGFAAITQVPIIADNIYTSKAIFGNIDYDLGELFTLHAGARYTKTKTEFEGCLANDPDNILPRAKAQILGGTNLALRNRLLAEGLASGCNTVLQINGEPSFGLFSGDVPEDNVSWRVGVDFKPGDDQLIYANVSRGYKAGSFANISASDADQYIPVKQEELTAYEIGFKSSLLNRRLQINGAAFYYDYKNKQLKGRTQVPIFGFIEALVNVPKSRIKGAELQIVAAPVEGLQITAGGTYIDSKVTSEFLNFSQLGQQISFNNAAFPYTSKWQFNGDVGHSWGVHEDVNAFVGASATYRSSTLGDFKPDPRIEITGYTLIDLRAGIEAPDHSWRLSVYGRNVADKYYWVTATRRSDAIVRFSGMPATYGVELALRFN